MARRFIGLVAALLITVGIVAVTDVKSRQSADMARARRAGVTAATSTTVHEPQVHLAALSAWDASPLVMPTRVPAGWQMTYAGILPAAETKEGCDPVEIDYEDPTDPDHGFVYLYEFPNDCATAMVGGTPFRAGPFRGFSRSSPEEGSVVQLTVEGTTVQATSDLSFDELKVVLQEFVPLDLSGLSAAQP
jgi:hypothetical protein